MIYPLKKILLLVIIMCTCLAAKPQTADTVDATIRKLPNRDFDIAPRFKNESLYNYISGKIRYPSKSRSNIVAYAVVNMFVDSNGIIENTKLLKSISPPIDNQILKAISKIGKLKPAILNSKPVNLNFVFNILITTDTTNQSIKVTTYRYHTYEISSNNPSTFEPIGTQQSATYPGGKFTYSQFLKNNLIYPPGARKNNIQGKVIIEFVIEKNGDLGDIEVTSSPDDELSMEAVRIVKIMPRFNPGLQNGRPVRSFFTLPINFTINK